MTDDFTAAHLYTRGGLVDLAIQTLQRERDEARAQLASATARISVLEAALKPFSDVGSNIRKGAEQVGDTHWIFTSSKGLTIPGRWLYDASIAFDALKE